MKHLNKQDIIALLDCAEIDKSIKEHLSNCDHCFSEYASMKSNYIEIKEATLEKTPQEFLEKAETTFNLNLVEKESSEGLLSKISKLFTFNTFNIFNPEISSNSIIFKPKFIGVAMVASVLLIMLYMPNPGIVNTQLYDFSMTLRSASEQTVFKDDLQNMSEDEIIKYAEDNFLILELTTGGKKFSQNPKKDERFTTEDTLKIILP
tara:strand:+ start:54 stop:671 length:618 start_codon:yes stop_codon:yes gene_type:complete